MHKKKNECRLFINCARRAKFRGNPKTLVTKDVKETLYLAWLMPQGKVISLKMKETKVGDRGSKSDNFNCL